MSHPRDDNDFEKGYDQGVWETLDEVRVRSMSMYHEILAEFPTWKVTMSLGDAGKRMR